MHTGDGVARREAHHERRAQERALLQEVDVDGLLATERQRTEVIVRVKAASIVVYKLHFFQNRVHCYVSRLWYSIATHSRS